MKALILAAGYATRLYPLTKEYPKPLLEVGKRPIINYILDKLETLKDVEEIIVVTNSKFISRFRQWAKGVKIDKQITLVDDLTKSHSDKRGAIGDMNFVIAKLRIRDDLLVIGGDNLFDGDLRDFISFAKSHRLHPAIGAYQMKDKRRVRDYGVIKIDRSNKVVDFQEKPRKPKSSLAAMCLYYFPKEKLKLVGEYLNTKTDKPRPSLKYGTSLKEERGKHDATGFYINWLIKKEQVYGFLFTGRWYDIGHHQFYHEAKEEFK